MDWAQNQRAENQRACSLSSLDADQLLSILQCLPVPSVLAFGMTCRRFRDLADTDSLWAGFCKRDWGGKAVDEWLSAGTRRSERKRMYRQMLALGSAVWHKLHQGDVGPIARASHSMVSVSGKIVIFGGGRDGGHHLDDTWIASLPEDSSENVLWQQASSGIPSGRFGQSCTVVEDAFVLFGGINDHGIKQCDTWINKGGYVTSAKERPPWQLLEVAGTPCARGAHAGCYAGDSKVVVHGGIGGDGNRLNDTWTLDLSEKPLPAWREVITLHSPPARSGHTLTWVDGKRMVLFGGRGTKFEVLNDVWLLDMEGEISDWVELWPCEVHDYPAPRAGHSATLIFGGRLLIYGGEDAGRRRTGDVWVLDPSVGIRGHTTSMCSDGSQTSCTETNKNKFGRKFWKKMKQWGQLPSKRSFHGACSMHSEHAVLIFGGMVGGEFIASAAAGLSFDAGLYLLELTP